MQILILKKVICQAYVHPMQVQNFMEVAQPIFKITLNAPVEKVKEIVQVFNQNHALKIQGVSGGGPWMDLIAPKVSKGTDLAKLLDYLNIPRSQLMAFGDGGNDIEMLQLAGLSYAMANGLDCAKKAAKFIAPSNDEQGVLQVIAAYLENE